MQTVPRLPAPLATFLIALALVFTGGCSKVYYGTMEMFGQHKRDILVDRVGEARDAQNEAKEEFHTALEKFTAVTNFKGGELEKKYNELKSAFDDCESRAKAVKSRIDDVDDVAEALFEEWEEELNQYSSSSLRARGETQLNEARVRYKAMLSAMRRAETRMTPVLNAFRDQVLFIKHNLNASAVASLQSEVANVESQVASLIQEMERSIAEADAFIKQMGTGGGNG